MSCRNVVLYAAFGQLGPYYVRVSSLNVRTVTGEEGNLANMMETRKVGVLCV